nr:CNNM domain-containing protein [Myxococcota bacterium]
MTVFVFSVATVLIVSAICSLTEASFYAVRVPFIRQITEEGSRAGRVLAGFKENMERPISAILIINTAANTAGAAVAGSQARIIFGESAIIWFSLLFTLAVLFFSEIVPKVVGVVHNRTIATWMALPWAGVIKMLHPIIWAVQHVAQVFKPSDPVLAAPEEEVQQMAMVSAEEGSIMPYEADLVRNVLRLDNVKARDIMTPRPVVFKLTADMTHRAVADKTKV